MIAIILTAFTLIALAVSSPLCRTALGGVALAAFK
jgi:hypothetical protein